MEITPTPRRRGRARNPRRAAPQHYDVLSHVATVPEVCQLFNVTRNAVIVAIQTDKIAAVQSGRTYIISLPSAAALWSPDQKLS